MYSCNSQEFTSVFLHKHDGDKNNSADGNVEHDQISMSVPDCQLVSARALELLSCLVKIMPPNVYSAKISPSITVINIMTTISSVEALLPSMDT